MDAAARARQSLEGLATGDSFDATPRERPGVRTGDNNISSPKFGDCRNALLLLVVPGRICWVAAPVAGLHNTAAAIAGLVAI